MLGMKATVLAKAGVNTTTGGAEAAADLLAGHGWSDGTWTNRLSQIRRWLAFCDEDERTARTEGDILAYIGYLSLDGKGGPVSARQYFTAVSRYHEDGGSNPLPRRVFSVQYSMHTRRRLTRREG